MRMLDVRGGVDDQESGSDPVPLPRIHSTTGVAVKEKLLNENIRVRGLNLFNKILLKKELAPLKMKKKKKVKNPNIPRTSSRNHQL